MVYKIDPLDLKALFAPVTAATAALSRLDERLARSPVCNGWIERQHFADAAASLWLEGELVHVEDLVLHDAHMDIRMPTHELTRAHAVLRARRQIASNKPGWALSVEGLRQLTRRVRDADMSDGQGSLTTDGQQSEEEAEPGLFVAEKANPMADAPDYLDAALAAIDAALERSAKVLDGQAVAKSPGRGGGTERSDTIYDPDWDEEARLAEWRDVITEAGTLPAVLRAAILIDAWGDIEVLQHASWLGPLLIASLLRQEGLASHHLPSWNFGAKQISRERRRSIDRNKRLIAFIDSIGEAATLGLKEHDRLMQAKVQMDRRLKDKRKNSKLPELITFALSRPLITAPLVEMELKISMQGALNLINDLGLREVTGRGRYRAWGIL